MPRIHWKPADKRLIVEESFRIRTNPSFTDSDLEAVRMAMRKIIKPADHRNLRAMAELPWVTDGWKELHKAKRENPAPIHYTPAIEAGTLPKHEQVQIPALISLESLGTEALAAELLRRLVQMTDPTYLDARLPGLLPPDIEPQPAPVEKERPRLIKIGVIGLLNSQQELFKNQYKDLVDFHFVDGNSSFAKVKNLAATMDWTYKTKWSDAIGKVSSLERFSSTNGGLDTIRKLIFEKFKVSPITK